MNKMLFELLPAIAFFVVYFAFGHDFFLAAFILIIAMMTQLAWMLLRRHKISSMQWATFVLVIVLGGISLLFRNQLFLQWKITVVSLLFAVALLIGDRFTSKPILQSLFGPQLQLPEKLWAQSKIWWVGFFISQALINLIIVYTLSTDIWVYYKLFGYLGMMILFTVLWVTWLYRQMPADTRAQFEQDANTPKA